MSKLTRRAFITTGIAAGGGLVVGIAMRPGNQVKNLASKLGEGGEGLIHSATFGNGAGCSHCARTNVS
jgi:isoquinoline 1-oxidoreductase beta subunit